MKNRRIEGRQAAMIAAGKVKSRIPMFHATKSQRRKHTARYLHGREQGQSDRVDECGVGVALDETNYGKGDDEEGEKENDDKN